MNNEPNIKLSALTLDCKDPIALSEFYAKLLHWDVPFHDSNYAVVGPPGVHQGGYPGITLQRNPAYEPPVWPEEPGAQQQMAHMDFAVNDLEQAVAYAVDCGAAIAQSQFSNHWTVMFDPAGHPFCLCEMKAVFDSPHFALQ